MQTAQSSSRQAPSRNDALLEHYPMVKRIAYKAAATYGLPVGVEPADLVSSGIIGLAEAWERFDSSRGVAFEAYAVTRIKGAVIDAIRGSDWVPRKARERSRRTGEPVVALVSLDGVRVSGHGSTAERVADESVKLPGFDMLADEQRREMLLSLNALPEREKLIITQHYFHGTQLADIARVLGVTESRVSQLHGRALKMLRAALEALDTPAVA